jgi:hypothetical protein
MAELTARLIKKFSVEKVGQNNTDKRIFVLNTEGEYAKDVAFILWKDKCSLLDKINMQQVVTVKYRPESREYNGKYFTDLIAYDVKVKENEQSSSTKTTEPFDKQDEKEEEQISKSEPDALPF